MRTTCLERFGHEPCPSHRVTSIIRTQAHEEDIKAVSATLLLLSLEDSPVGDFSKAFQLQGADVLYFSAGAGGKGGEERTKSVDYQGALKVFDAIEAVETARLRLILVSAIDVRDPEKMPAHYTEEDIAMSKRVHGAIAAYMKWKYEADKKLVKRTAFKGLNNESGTGKASIGHTHLSPTISRDDVATALAALLDREDAVGLAIDMVGGEPPIAEGLDAVIKKGETDFP
ncbi:hypothetical protein R3P38DRAFT_2801154 [Favolaschia claudopus]|uniref:NAD(P)-binding domain-containing protein n=1 Tax=Favolaschia claudopus TaxID=2862362 RepID=A0AAV9ZWA0_9AGAR